ncbi:MAG: hypothetical protein IJ193_09300 [Bacilli bacterium]|nr:hypothetical protein [Bacilli bacterium]
MNDNNVSLEEVGYVPDDDFVYNPIVEEDTEIIESEIQEFEPFRIDENMPEELKAQLLRFNEKSRNFHNIVTGNDMDLVNYDKQLSSASDSLESDEDETGEIANEEEVIDDIEEDDSVEIGNLF